MKQYIEMMGHKFQDRVTGFQGIAESVCFDLYGCVQVALKPASTKNKDGVQEIGDSRWFDSSRLKKVSSARVMGIPTFERLEHITPMPGPADKSTMRSAR